ncbi:hypothetical protein [Pedobacter mendelii]|uniref:hypothetical protein n=1 Tax=Pedobacter mendelii TaxID=1908240 RepID=UPI001665F174|nr:hypothetical protein [Pedobacter mendelii]
MKTLFLLLFIITIKYSLAPKEVYICNNGNTKKYHYTSNCRGLSNCSYKIVKSTIDKAKKDGKTLCGWEK